MSSGQQTERKAKTTKTREKNPVLGFDILDSCLIVMVQEKRFNSKRELVH